MNHILAPAGIAHYYSRLAKPSTPSGAYGGSSRAHARGIFLAWGRKPVT